jgi:ATP-dependent DNA ligase
MTDFSPMLATKCDKPLDTLLDQVWEPKLDGIRCFVHDGKLFTRQGNNVTEKFPDIVVPPLGVYLDGEIIFTNEDGHYDPNSFTKCQKRTRNNAHTTYGLARLVLFDFHNPFHGHTQDVLHTRRKNMRSWYEGRADRLCNVDMIDVFTDPDLDLLPILNSMGYEGVMIKAPRSYYTPGKRSKQWLKHKFLQDASFVVTGYEEGEGSLEGTVGALHLSLVKGSDIIDVGKVGTGMSVTERHHLLDTINLGEPFVVDVEFQEVSTQGKLRFPSYKGIRTDVSVTDCTYEQLDTSKGR